MRHTNTSNIRSFFKVLTSTASAQVAMMTLRPGQSSSEEPENEHPKCEQWLFVIEGSGQAIVSERKVTLKKGSLLLIEKNEKHQISCEGKAPLVTLNIYSPPAYREDGELRPSAKK